MTIGDDNNNLLEGLDGDDRLDGLGGNDTLLGAGGSDTLDGGDGDDLLNGGTGEDWLFGWGGNDTLRSDGTAQMSGGDGDDLMYGQAGQQLFGGDGRDEIHVTGNATVHAGWGYDRILISGGGNVVDGGAGDDEYEMRDFAGQAPNLIQEQPGDGVDTIWSHQSLSIAPFAGIEGLILAGEDAIDGTGNELDNGIVGNAAANVLDGGRGIDRLTGRDGGDTYVVDATFDANGVLLGIDQVVEHADDTGIDTVRTDVDGYVLADNVENLEMSGRQAVQHASGNALANLLTGSQGDDAISGDEGNDTLDGGAGSDMLLGGEGVDTFRFGRGAGRDTLGYESDVMAGEVMLGAGITQGDVLLRRNDRDLFLTLRGTDDELLIEDCFDPALPPIAAIRFEDGTHWDMAALTERTRDLQGTPGRDHLIGTMDDDILHGHDGDDTLEGGPDTAPRQHNGKDTLIGGAGNDLLIGGTGTDTYVFGRGDGHDIILADGADPGESETVILNGLLQADMVVQQENKDLVLTIQETGETLRLNRFYTDPGDPYTHPVRYLRFADDSVVDVLSLGAPLWGTQDDDFIVGDALNNVIHAGAGHDVLLGKDGDDTLLGENDRDELIGDAGDDILDGGAGDDRLVGGEGDDTFVFGLGHGHDTIFTADEASSKLDAVALTPGIAPQDVLLRRDGMDLLLSFRQDPDQKHSLRVVDHFVAMRQIDAIRFADGTRWDSARIAHEVEGSGPGADLTIDGSDNADWLSGGPGHDLIHGLDGGDTIEGGRGNDTLHGGKGHNVYLFGRGDGADLIHFDAIGSEDVIRLLGDILPDEVMLSRAGDALVIALKDTPDRISLVDYFAAAPGGRPQYLSFDEGTVWHLASKITQPTNGRDTLIGEAINDTLAGWAGDDHLYGADGHDHLDGGEGQDLLIGGKGDDTYVFGIGYGHDTIDAIEPVPSGIDMIQLKGIALHAADLTVTTMGSSVLLGIQGESDSLLVKGPTVEGQWAEIQYIGFENGGFASLHELIDGHLPVENLNDTLYGTWADERLWAGSGNDRIHGQGGKDTLEGGNGDDLLVGGDHEDLLMGDAGADTLIGGRGNDRYVFTRGGGQDSIEEDPYQPTGGFDTLVMDGDIAPQDLYHWTEGSMRVLALSASERISFKGTSIEQVVFTGSGKVWTLADLNAMFNSPPTGTVRITGTAAQKQTLTASHTLQDSNQLGTVSYRWLRNGVFTGLTGSTYKLDQVDVGSRISVTASYVDGLGTPEAVTSAQTAVVANVNDAPTGTVLLSGTAIQGATLSASHTLADKDGLGSVSYEWLRDGQLIGAAGASYLLTQADVGRRITARARYTDGYGALEAISSAASEAVANVNDAPTGGVTLSGLAIQGQTLTAEHTLADADGLGELQYRWLRDGLDTGATGASYTLTQADVGARLSFTAHYTDGQGTVETIASGASQPVANIDDAPTGQVLILGTAAEDGTLTASHTLEDADGLGAINYEWLRDGIATGATGASYTLGQADVGRSITVTARYTDGHGHAESIGSAPTGAIANVNDLPTGGVGIIGQPTQGQTLTATHTLGDEDGLGPIAYRWLRDGVDTGVDGATYALGQADVGARISVVARYTDGQGTAETIASAPTGAVIRPDLTLSGGSGRDTLTGGLGHDTLRGLADNDVLRGEAGDDSLDGGTGTDSLIGGTGDDIYVVDATLDAITENAEEGQDVVQSSATYTLSSHVENLTLTGTGAINATGNAQNNVLTGNSAANQLNGGAGHDTMAGGAGNDTLTGGTGDDVYILDGGSDAVRENAGEGTDTIQTAVTFSLASLTNIENLTLTGTAAANATGNGRANVLTGNGAANTLTGGADADTLIGAEGNDLYIVDHAGDVLIEKAGEGTDAVQSSVTYTLADHVEQLTLTGYAAIHGTGNAGDNLLTGNSAANNLTGGAGNDTLNGGAGGDLMTGGKGDDTYQVDSSADRTIENADEGIDLVLSGIGWTLASHVDNLTLTGTSAINGTGNGLSNTLVGNGAANTLTGAGGHDTYQGGLGADILNAVSVDSNDTFVWGRGDGADTLTDAGGSDQLRILAGVTADQVWLRRVTNNLEVSIIGTRDKFTIVNWYTSTANQVERLTLADGKTLGNGQVQGLVNAMAAFAPPASGQTTLPAGYRTALDPVIAANWV